MSKIALDQIPKLNNHFRLQWEPVQQAYVLLYPEGMVKLNGPAGEILTRFDGEKSIQKIIEDLQAAFPEAEDIAGDIVSFTVEAHEQNWITL